MNGNGCRAVGSELGCTMVAPESRSPSRLKRMALQGERPGQGQSGTRTLALKVGPGWTFTKHKTHQKQPRHFLSNGKIRNQYPKHTWNIRAGPTHVGFTTTVDLVLEAEPTRQGVRVQNRLTGPTAGHVLRGEGHQGVQSSVTLELPLHIAGGRAGASFPPWSKRTWGPAFCEE